MKRLLGHDYRNPQRAPEHRRGACVPGGERPDPPSPGRLGYGGVPIFPNTREGQAALKIPEGT